MFKYTGTPPQTRGLAAITEYARAPASLALTHSLVNSTTPPDAQASVGFLYAYSHKIGGTPLAVSLMHTAVP